MSTKQRFNNIIAQLSVNYQKKLTEADIANFRIMLDRWGIDRFERAVTDHMFDPEDGRFFPNIANIAKQAEGEAKDKARSSFSLIVNEMSRVGWCGTPRLDHITQAVVIALGGWHKLCKAQYDELPALERKFVERYTEYDKMTLKTIPDGLPGAKQLIEHNLSRVEAKRLGESNE